MQWQESLGSSSNGGEEREGEEERRREDFIGEEQESGYVGLRGQSWHGHGRAKAVAVAWPLALGATPRGLGVTPTLSAKGGGRFLAWSGDMCHAPN